MVTRIATAAAILSTTWLLCTPISAAELPSGWSWLSPHHRDHPLAGQIWGAAVNGPVPLAVLREAVAAADLALIGEVHDNPDHHRLQALLVQGRRGAAAFEHIRADQQQALEHFAGVCARARRPCIVGDLLKALDWQNSGWPPADVFAPLFSAVLRARLAIVAGDAPRETMRAVVRQGEIALASRERTALGLDDPLEPSLIDALTAELEAGHCGALPPSALAGLALAQRYRDAHLARALGEAAAKHGAAILFAGNGHVRSDRGVPWYLRSSRKTTVSVMLLELAEDKADLAAYVPRAPDGRPAADFVVLTPRAERPDPCAGLRERLQRKRK